ncbi:DNA methyltransferase [Paraliobacillus zengyii]|uniref:DNA methyltransferase n=1 Tax=Paraliobacillus zengyii TaxID=2213194 RepID=UPI000E3E0FC9|nr:DNA methyltransferase [Paraliobacillus zengyii]
MLKPINTTVRAKSHTAPYRMHKYFARRPYNVFQNLIEHYTSENEVVLDVFCGGGVTVFESLSLNRKAIGVDINPLATFITEMQVKHVSIEELEELFESFMNRVIEKYDHFYNYNIDGCKYSIEWVEWAYEVACPHCGRSIVLKSENKVIKQDGKPKNGYYCCPNQECQTNYNKNPGIRRTDCKPIASIPIRMKLIDDSTSESHIHLLNEEEVNVILNEKFNSYMESRLIKPDEEIPLNWDRAHEDKLFEKGVKKFSDLFTKRNYTLNVLIFNEIMSLKNSIDVELVDCLYFAFSSSLRYTNNMSRVTDNWENGNPTSMDKHAYWLPNEYIEANVIQALKKRMAAVKKGLEYSITAIPTNPIAVKDFSDLLKTGSHIVLNQSSSDLLIPDKSVDAIITDPPYGSNVQYGELSSYWTVWLKHYKGLNNFIYSEEEAIMNRKKALEGFKDVYHYEEVLYQVFNEGHRVLKDEGYLVFTFNNKNLKVWVALLKATIRAGFVIAENGVIFQDFVQSYKNTSHLKYSGNVHGDFIYSFVKGEQRINLELVGKEPIKYIKESISKKIEEMYLEEDSYTTTKLYQGLFSDLVNILSDLIVIDTEADNNWFASIEEESNDFIDRLLKTELVFENDLWFKREVNENDIIDDSI